jgi:hypothetical protein
MPAQFRGPLGPGGTWKTGQRVPESGFWVDQHRFICWFDEHTTFPPCVGRKGECAYRKRYKPSAETA